MNIAIEDDATAVGKRCLSMDLDGAAAEVESPPIRVMSRFSYVFEAQLKKRELELQQRFVTLDFCDANGRVLQTAEIGTDSQTNGWQTFVWARSSRAIRRSITRIELAGCRGAQGRLARPRVAGRCVARTAAADRCFDEQSVQRLHRLERRGIECALSGIREHDPEIHFQLLDGSNNELQNETSG